MKSLELRRKRDRDYKRLFRKEKPWMTRLVLARSRCSNPNHPKYSRYGGRGIKCLITKEEIKELWFRDKAYLLKLPTIDRIDNNGNYTFKNCRFIENGDNTRARGFTLDHKKKLSIGAIKMHLRKGTLKSKVGKYGVGI
jgi:hypothetical protein